MPTIEERLQALEREHQILEREHQTLEQQHVELRKTIELQTIAIRALVAKEAFEKLQETMKESQEQNGKLFNVLINQGALHNERMTDLQGQIINLDGKTTGLQTEMRQRFTEQDGKIAGLQTEMHQGFAEHTALLQQILARLPEQP
jgi:hypothetical protein